MRVKTLVILFCALQLISADIFDKEFNSKNNYTEEKLKNIDIIKKNEEGTLEKVQHLFTEFKEQGVSHNPSNQQVVKSFVIATDEFGNVSIFEEDVIITSVPAEQQETSSGAASSTSSDARQYSSTSSLATTSASNQEKYGPGANIPKGLAQGDSCGQGNSPTASKLTSSSGHVIEGSTSLSSASTVPSAASKFDSDNESIQKVQESGATSSSDAVLDLEGHGSRQRQYGKGHDGIVPYQGYYGSGQRGFGFSRGDNGPAEKGYGYNQRKYESGQTVSDDRAASSGRTRADGTYGPTDSHKQYTEGSSSPSTFGQTSGTTQFTKKGSDSSSSLAAADSASPRIPYGATELNGQGPGYSLGRGDASGSDGLSRLNNQYRPGTPGSAGASSSNPSSSVLVIGDSTSNSAVVTSSGSGNNQNGLYRPGEPYGLSGQHRSENSSSGAASNEASNKSYRPSKLYNPYRPVEHNGVKRLASSSSESAVSSNNEESLTPVVLQKNLAGSSLASSGGSGPEGLKGPHRSGTRSSLATESGASMANTIDISSKHSNPSSVSATEFVFPRRSWSPRICCINRKHLVVRVKGCFTS